MVFNVMTAAKFQLSDVEMVCIETASTGRASTRTVCMIENNDMILANTPSSMHFLSS